MSAPVGFIGLGTMGLPMCRNVAKGGYSVVAYDTDETRVRQAKEHPNVKAAKTVAEVGQAASIVITMLPSPAVVSQVVEGPSGLLESMTPESIWIDMSTMDPLLSQTLAKEAQKRGIRAIDGPVGRTSKHAEAGTLIVLAAGTREDVETVTPLFTTMAEEIVYCGENGMGQAMKVVNNQLATILLAADSEALVLGRRAGLTLQTMMQVFKLTAAYNNQLPRLEEVSQSRDFSPGFKVWLAEKDMTLAKDLARSLQVPVMMASVAREKLTEVMADGGSDEDVSALLKFYERTAHIVVSSEP